MMIVKNLFSLKYSRILAVISFLLYSFSFYISYEDETANHLYMYVKAGLVAASALLFLISCRTDCDEQIKTQYAVLSLVILIYQILLWIAVGRTIIYVRDYPAILNGVLWTVCSLVSVLRFGKGLFSKAASVIRERETAALLVFSAATALIVIILSLVQGGVRFAWDSNTMYEFIKDKGYGSLYDARQLLFSTHVSIVYCYILAFFKFLFGDILVAFFFMNALCAVAASLGITFLLRRLMPEKKIFSYMLANMLFMFSPWVCGMSTYYMYDYYIWCLYPLLIYFCVRREWIGFFSVGVMITFSRAPGVMVFGGVCAGVLLLELKEKRLRVLADIKYWAFASVAIVFCVFYRAIDRAEETWGSFWGMGLGFDRAHVLHIIKMFTTTNFIWIFFALTIALIIAIIFGRGENPVSIEEAGGDEKNCKFEKPGRECITTVWIMLISDLILFVVYAIVITYRLPRYMDSHISVVYICAILFLTGMGNRILSYVLTIAITVVTFIGSFRMIDPVSLALFKTLDVGDHRIVDFEMTERGSFEDSIICNREYNSYILLLDKVMGSVLDSASDGDEILFSLADQSLTWGFSGGRYSYNHSDGKTYFWEFFDKSTGKLTSDYRYEYFDEPDMIPFEVRYIFPTETVGTAVSGSGAERFFYIYMPTLNVSKENEVFDNYNVEKEESFDYLGWKMNCITFTR